MTRPQARGAALTVDLYDATMAATEWPIYTPDDSDDIPASTAGSNESLNLPGLPRGFFSDDGGDIAIEDRNGVSITLATTALTPVTEFAPTKILATGTTANAVHLMY